MALDPLNPHLSLGYCCLNTRLQQEKIFCSRACRLPTLKAEGPELAERLALQNLKDVLPILKWNEDNNIKVFRLSSDIFPLQAHPDVAYPMDFAQDLLTEIGNTARSNGHRLTLHPSQHHVLSTKSESTLENTTAGLEQQCEVLDRMGLDKQSIMVIHGGGVYGNKPEALERLKKNIMALKQNVRERLVLENDEMAYTIEDLLPISQKLKIPIVVDFHHDAIYPSSQPVDFYLPLVFAVWDERGIKPKVHVSQSVPGVDMNSKTARRAHGPYIDTLPDALLAATRDIDVMFEAKMKEDAVLRYREKHGAPATMARAYPETMEIDLDADEVDSPAQAKRKPWKKAEKSLAVKNVTKDKIWGSESAPDSGSLRKQSGKKSGTNAAVTEIIKEEEIIDHDGAGVSESPKKKSKRNVKNGAIQTELIDHEGVAVSEPPKKKSRKTGKKDQVVTEPVKKEETGDSESAAVSGPAKMRTRKKVETDDVVSDLVEKVKSGRGKAKVVAAVVVASSEPQAPSSVAAKKRPGKKVAILDVAAVPLTSKRDAKVGDRNVGLDATDIRVTRARKRKLLS